MPPESTTDKPPHLHSLQLLRALAVIAVILFHLEGNMFQLGLISFRILHSFAYSGVDLFFVISGFTIAYVHHDDIGHFSRAKQFAWRRFIRIFPNYWVVCAMAALMVYTLHYRSNITIDWFASLSLLIPQAHHQQLIPVAWSLNFELLFYMFFLLCIKLEKRVYYSFLLAWIMIVLSMQDKFTYTRDLHWIEFFFASYFYEFIIGMGAAILIRHQYTPHPFYAIAFSAVAIAITLTLNIYYFTENLGTPTMREWRGMLYALIYGPLLYAFVCYELRTATFRSLPWLGHIGDASYTYYLTHILLLVIWEQLHLTTDPLLYASGYLTLCYAYGLAHYRFIEKPLLHHGRNMFLSYKRP